MRDDIDLNELRRQWATLGDQLNGTLGTDGERLYERIRQKAANAVKPLGRVNILEVLSNVGLVVVLAGFALKHAADVGYLLAALELLAVWLVLSAAGVWQWVAFRRIDLRDPVVLVQERIATLIAVRVATLKWLILLMPLIWLPMCVVGGKMLFDVDVVGSLSGWVIGVNLLAWVVWAAILLAAAHYFRNRVRRPSLLGWIADDLAGKGLFEAHKLAEQAGLLEELGIHTMRGTPDKALDAEDAVAGTVYRELLRLRVVLALLIAAIVCTGAFIAGHVADGQAIIAGAALDVMLLLTLVGIAWQVASAPGMPAAAKVLTLIRRRHIFVVACMALAPVAIAVLASVIGTAWFGLPPLIVSHAAMIAVISAVWAAIVVLLAQRGAFTFLGTRRLRAAVKHGHLDRSA